MAIFNTQIKSSGGGSSLCIPLQVDNGTLKHGGSVVSLNQFSSVVDIDSYALYKAFKNASASEVSGALNMGSLVGSGSYGLCEAFYGCSGLTSVSMPLACGFNTNACDHAFYDCGGITSINIGNLTGQTGNSLIINGQRCFSYAFSGCVSLNSVDNFVSHITSITGSYALEHAFENTNVRTVWFSMLSEFGSSCNYPLQYAFLGCRNLTDIWFVALSESSFSVKKTQFTNLLNDCDGVTIHLPSSLEGSSKITGMTGYPDFGGTNTTILYDADA